MAATMQANAVYDDHNGRIESPPLPRYESFDGSQYSGVGYDRESMVGVANGGYDRNSSAQNGGYDFRHPSGVPGGGPRQPAGSHQITLDTLVRTPQEDPVGLHMLYETAMLDSRPYEVLDISEVDALKKELVRLHQRIEAANRKLALETKVKEAAQNLQRLYSTGEKRADTPQSPDADGRRMRSGLVGRHHRSGSSGGGSGQTLHQAEDELAVSSKKVEDLQNEAKALGDRKTYVEQRLLRHTAGVLAAQSARITEEQANAQMQVNGHRQDTRLDYGLSPYAYAPDEFDGIRDILAGAAPSSISGRSLSSARHPSPRPDQQQDQMNSIQARLEELNNQLRQVITETSRIRGSVVGPDSELEDAKDEPNTRVGNRLARLQNNIHILENEQEGVRAHYSRLQDSAHMTVNAVEEQLENINGRLHHTLLLEADMQGGQTMREPPQATGHGYQRQLEYLNESLGTMEQILAQHRSELDKAREISDDAGRAIEDAQSKAFANAHKIDEYEATLGGLWEILQSDLGSDRKPSSISMEVDDRRSFSPLPSPLKEDFSLQAFSARVQHIFDRAQSAREQQEILRRQVQQQRELNGKSDAEKDRQLSELQTKHEGLVTEHEGLREAHARAESDAAQSRVELMNVTNEMESLKRTIESHHTERGELQSRHDLVAGEYKVVEEELVKAMAQREQAESEVAESRVELMNVMNEFEGLKKVVEQRQQERDEMAKHVQTAQAHAKGLEEQIEELEARVEEMSDDAMMSRAEAEARVREAEEKHGALTEQLAVSTKAKEEAETKHAETKEEMEGLESELIRLSTELAMAKAELEGAYGSRAERAKEAHSASLNAQLASLQSEHETLRSIHTATLAELEEMRKRALATDKTKNLQAELGEMTDAFTELTKESIELEKERQGLEDLIDGLRERCEVLEQQVADERVRWLGVKSPGAVSVNGAAVGANGEREATSTMVLRQEFKKMMREARAEGLRALRVSVFGFHQ